LDPEKLHDCLRTLEALVDDPSALVHIELEARNRLLAAAGRLSRPERDQQRVLAREWRKHSRAKTRAEDESKLARAGIRKKRLDPVFITPAAAALGGGSIAVPELASADDSADALSEAPLVLDEASAGVDADGPSELPAAIAELSKPRSCYQCKKEYTKVHFFYDRMCTACGDLNYRKRSQTADLRGRVAYISGARVKIGYQAAILLLRAGAKVIVSTRFPNDAAARYAREPDFGEWGHRLAVYGLDLRHTPSVEAFARHLHETEETLDFVIHNACQTVRRPTGFYAHLMEAERQDVRLLPQGAAELLRNYEAFRTGAKQLGTSADGTLALAGRAYSIGMHRAAELSQVALAPEDLQRGTHLFPEGQLDQDLQQRDLRDINTWRLTLDQVGTVELLEVQLVNAIAPFVLNARLRSLMTRKRTGDKHIVNVSAMEGQFYRRFKTDKHPHTNMAKAALNMMTRTSAIDYVKDGIHMNSVDTGWVTDEDPAHIAERKEREGFQPPLDIVDGAARIVDPILDGINTGKHVWGLFLKDYAPVAW
jgi:NAD(P)-dependent dehydrogenase (short-subunit alcohol dehydrogenase family)